MIANGYMKYNALIPVKSLMTAKSRLASSFTQHQRERLVLDMFHHVLCVLLDSELFEKVSVVSSDNQVLEKAYLWGAQAVVEEYHGHNQALHAAALREMSEGVTPLAVPYVFGPGSLQNYVEAARQKHLSYSKFHSVGLALDIDTIDDLDEAEDINSNRKETVYGC